MDFQMRYDDWYLPLARALWTGPKHTVIRVADGRLTVKHGWVFRIEIPLASVRSAKILDARPLAWGVHVSAGGWLVNGSRDGIVDIRFDPPIAPARAPLNIGKVRAVQVSVTDPDGLVAAVSPSRPG